MGTPIYVVEFSKFAAKQIPKLPTHIREAIFIWKNAVEIVGLLKVMRSSGYHDEPLQGHRRGQRSVRLNRAYRLIYELSEREEIIIVGVLEVNKHDYR
jgi:proteic killer suppression protein